MGRLGDGIEADGESDVVGLFDDAAHRLGRVVALVVVGAEVAVVGSGGEHVPDRGDDRVLDGDQGLERGGAAGESSVACLEVAVLGSDGTDGGVAERSLQMVVAGPGADVS